jgi:hypothetical protein
MKNKTPDNTGKIREYQEEPGGKFREGNPGKPPGAKSKITLLEEALEKVAEQTGKDFYEVLAIWAYKKPNVALGILKKFIPDVQRTEVEDITPQPQLDLSGFTTEEIRKFIHDLTDSKAPFRTDEEIEQESKAKMDAYHKAIKETGEPPTYWPKEQKEKERIDK